MPRGLGWLDIPAHLRTLQRLNESVPELSLILERIGRLIASVDSELSANTADSDPAATLLPKLEAELEHIHAMGGVVLSLERGVLGFPYELDGEHVLLCWEHGEPEISHFCAFDGDLATRKPLPTQLMGAEPLRH